MKKPRHAGLSFSGEFVRLEAAGQTAGLVYKIAAAIQTLEIGESTVAGPSAAEDDSVACHAVENDMPWVVCMLRRRPICCCNFFLPVNIKGVRCNAACNRNVVEVHLWRRDIRHASRRLSETGRGENHYPEQLRSQHPYLTFFAVSSVPDCFSCYSNPSCQMARPTSVTLLSSGIILSANCRLSGLSLRSFQTVRCNVLSYSRTRRLRIIAPS